MKVRRLSVVLVILLGIFSASALLVGGRFGLGSPPDPTPQPIGEQPYPDAYKLAPRPPAELPVPGRANPNLTHPCGGMLAEPIFSGVSPLSISYVPGMCSGGYGDIAVWQANGHDYVAQSGFAVRMYHIWNVDDPYNPVLLRSEPFPLGGTASTALFDFKQNGNYYMSVGMRGSGTGCGYFIYNVNDPANPAFVSRTQGTDWCTVHETFVSTDINGNADYAWLTMSGESGSGWKIVALNLANIAVPIEGGRYQRPDSRGGTADGIFVHDSNVVGNRVYVAHWQGGMLIFDKQTLATTVQPAPLSPLDGIRPYPAEDFKVHHTVPTTDGKFVFIEDEFLNGSNLEKIKVYDITNINSPVYLNGNGIRGEGAAATSQAHNMVIQPISPGLDRLYVGWYKAGMRMYEVNTSGATPIITQTGMHQLRQTTGSGFGGVWGVDYLPCTLKGQPHTCIYSSDYEKFGLFVDALGYDPMLDPYEPESILTDPINNQNITGCAYTIRGTSHDYYSGVQRVEVSTNGGLTWQIAQGTDNWTYDWTIPGNGSYTIKARAVDVAGNIQTLNITTVTVNVTSCAGGPTPTPQPSATNTSVVPTNTPIVPTNTPVQPSPTSIIPTSTGTAVMPTSTRTNTPIQPTNTIIPEPTNTASATPTTCAITFSDVPSDHTFYSFIRCLACRGVMGGYLDGTFRPDNTITRGQLAKMVSNAAGYNDLIPSDRQSFEDVPPSHPFWLWIERLLLHGPSGGIITGYECGGEGEPCGPDSLPYFRPYSPVTRGQIAKIVSNAAGFNDDPGPQTFADVNVTHPFWVWIERLAMHNVMGGYECGGEGEPCDGENRPYFRAFNDATRGQVAKIVANGFFPNCQTPARP